MSWQMREREGIGMLVVGGDWAQLITIYVCMTSYGGFN